MAKGGGTDWFDCNRGVGSVCFCGITDEDRHDMLHRNAERLLAPLIGSGPPETLCAGP